MLLHYVDMLGQAAYIRFNSRGDADMNAQRGGSALKTDITIALHSLGREHRGWYKRQTIQELREMLAALRKEQVAAGIIKKTAAA